MKIKIGCLLLCSFMIMGVMAQPGARTGESHFNGKSNAISLGMAIPFGDFSNTHFGGIAIDYSWTDHRYSHVYKNLPKPFGFTFNTGIDYYFGKKETVASYNYHYPGYTYFHVYGGAIYNPCRRGNISLTTGPALNLYDGNAEFGFGINLSGSIYPFSNRNIALSPGILYMKQSGNDPLLAATVKATLAF